MYFWNLHIFFVIKTQKPHELNLTFGPPKFRTQAFRLSRGKFKHWSPTNNKKVMFLLYNSSWISGSQSIIIKKKDSSEEGIDWRCNLTVPVTLLWARKGLKGSAQLLQTILLRWNPRKISLWVWVVLIWSWQSLGLELGHGVTPVIGTIFNFEWDGDDGTPRKSVRGPTFLPSFWARQEGDRIRVLFNEYGQPWQGNH